MDRKKACMLISNSFNPDNRVYRSAKALVDNGYEVSIICTLDSPDKLPGREKIDGILVKRVTHWLPLVPLKKKEYGFCKAFLKAAVDEKADIYHANDFDTLLFGYRAAKKNNAKLIYDSHEYWRDKNWNLDGFWYRNLGKLYVKLLEPFLARKADVVITVSDGIASQLKKDLNLNIRPMVIANYINKQDVKKSDIVREKLKIPSKNNVIVYTGVVAKGRGLEKLIAATRFLPPNYTIVIIGHGNYRETLIELVEKNIMGGRVKFINKIPYEKIVEYNSSADVGVAPIQNISFSYYHCAPNKISEYIMSGIPIAVSNFPEMGKIVNKYKIGETFDPEKPQDIAAAIMKVVANKGKYGENLKKAAKELNWERESRKLIKAYEQI